MENELAWYAKGSLEDAKEIIITNIDSASRSFVTIGYYLKQIRDNGWFESAGYKNVWELAQAEFSISKSYASKLMAINDKFSIDGNSPMLLEQFNGFSSSKLSEMLYLSDEQMEKVTLNTTVVEIREIKSPEKTVSTSKQEPGEIVIVQTIQPKKRCSGKSCFMCDRQCEDRTEDQYCIFAPMGNPFSCTTRNVLDAIRADGIDCPMLISREGNVFGNNETGAICCNNCIDRCGFICNKARKLEIKPPTEEDVVLHEEPNKKSNWQAEPPIFEDDMDGYGWTRSTIVRELFKEISKFELYIDEIDGQCCEAFRHKYFVYNIGGYIEFENIDSEVVFRVSVGRIKREYGLFNLNQVSEEVIESDLGHDENHKDSIEKDLGIKLDAVEIVETDVVDSTLDATKLAKELLVNHQQRLKEILNILKDTNDKTELVLIEKRKLAVAAFALLVNSFDEIEKDEPEQLEQPDQPELPILRNNDQRKEFLEGYETWPIWIDNNDTGERYFRYNLNDGSSIVMKVYLSKDRVYDKISGGREVERYSHKEEFLLEAGKHFKNGETNMTALIEHLKKVAPRK